MQKWHGRSREELLCFSQASRPVPGRWPLSAPACEAVACRLLPCPRRGSCLPPPTAPACPSGAGRWGPAAPSSASRGASSAPHRPAPLPLVAPLQASGARHGLGQRFPGLPREPDASQCRPGLETPPGVKRQWATQQGAERGLVHPGRQRGALETPRCSASVKISQATGFLVIKSSANVLGL